MPSFSLDKLPKEQRIQLIAEFYDVISSLKGREEVRLFFRDLLTPDEIAMLMRRLEVAVLIRSGFTYTQISQLLGVGKDKVTSVQRSLRRHGDGYNIAMKRLLDSRKAKMKRQAKREKTKSSDFEKLKKKYPLGFLLFNLVDEVGGLMEENASKESVQREVALSTPSRRR